MIEQLIRETLELAGVPVYFMVCKEKTPDQYIIWKMILEQGELHVDDSEDIRGHYIQVNIWSKTNYFLLKNTVRTVMVANGFIQQDDRDGEYDYKMKYYNRSQKYYYELEE